MLKSVDHDSMSGEHVGTASRLIMRSGKLEIWPLTAPENQGLRKATKIPKGGKKTREKIDKQHMRGGKTLPSMLGKKIFDLSCCYEHEELSVRQEEPAKMDFPCCYEHCGVSVRQEDNYQN